MPILPVKIRLVALSFLMLFPELALIRWTGSNNHPSGVSHNFVCLPLSRHRCRLPASACSGPICFPLDTSPRWRLLVIFVLAFPVTLTTLEGPNQLEGAWGMAALPRWVSLGIIFLLTSAVRPAS